MLKIKAEKKLVEFLPTAIVSELVHLCSSRGCGISEVSEVRIRAHGVSSAVIRGERIRLLTAPTSQDVKRCFLNLCEGALYAHRDTIRDGYVTLPFGIRVGVCGEARYEGGSFIGVSEISSLVFRIPTGASSNASLIYEAFRSSKRGMLIYSLPAVGKTTALRSLVSMLGEGKEALQVVVVDERREFITEEYKSQSVDILRGYRRAEGIEIALRVLSAEVICVDEIGTAREAEAILESLNSGVRFIATAHASSYEELKKRANIRSLLESGVFDVYVGLAMKNGARVAEITRLDN